MLFHAFKPEMLSGERKERSGSAGNDPEEWRKSYRATKEGVLYLIPEQIFGVCREGAKYTKKGKGSIQKSVAATLQILDKQIVMNRTLVGDPTQDPEQEVYLDVRGVVNPATRGRNVRYRVATREGWEATFTLEFDPSIVDRNQMQAVLIDAGKLVGLGDARAIGYGRFEVVAFTV